MGKQDQYNRGKKDGLILAKRIIKEGGLEALEKEIEFRGRTGINLNLQMKETDEALNNIKECIYETMLCQTLFTLHDEFGFADKRLKRFLKRFNFKTACMACGLVNWADMVDEIKNKWGIQIDVFAMEREGLIPEYMADLVMDEGKKRREGDVCA